MKKMVLGLFAGMIALSGCEKNNCYTCKLVVRDDAGVYSSRPLQKRCRIKRSELDQWIQDSTRSYEGVNKYRGNIKVTFNQTIECTKDNYW